LRRTECPGVCQNDFFARKLLLAKGLCRFSSNLHCENMVEILELEFTEAGALSYEWVLVDF
jgi:hypothetical protein